MFVVPVLFFSGLLFSSLFSNATIRLRESRDHYYRCLNELLTYSRWHGKNKLATKFKSCINNIVYESNVLFHLRLFIYFVSLFAGDIKLTSNVVRWHVSVGSEEKKILKAHFINLQSAQSARKKTYLDLPIWRTYYFCA